MSVLSWQTRAADYQQRLVKPRGLKCYRCNDCRGRKVLNRELWEYMRPPRCKCGASDWRIDMTRYKEWKTKTGSYAICACDGIHHPHKPGSNVWCEQHKTGPTEQDFKDRYGSTDIEYIFTGG